MAIPRCSFFFFFFLTLLFIMVTIVFLSFSISLLLYSGVVYRMGYFFVRVRDVTGVFWLQERIAGCRCIVVLLCAFYY